MSTQQATAQPTRLPQPAPPDPGQVRQPQPASTPTGPDDIKPSYSESRPDMPAEIGNQPGAIDAK